MTEPYYDVVVVVGAAVVVAAVAVVDTSVAEWCNIELFAIYLASDWCFAGTFVVIVAVY